MRRRHNLTIRQYAGALVELVVFLALLASLIAAVVVFDAALNGPVTTPPA